MASQEHKPAVTHQASATTHDLNMLLDAVKAL